jgi:hypothetical protein
MLQAMKTGYWTKTSKRGSPVPLWLQARAQTINFHRDELERTHCRKIWRAMGADRVSSFLPLSSG